MRTLVTSDCLESMSLPKAWRSGAYGAILEFRGCVRNTHEGRSVSGIEYDAEPVLALNVLNKIRSEMLHANPALHDVCIFHRTGKLELGETSLIVGLAGPHRENLFNLCDAIIIRIKQEVPIWKHEIYTDSSRAWLKGTSLRAQLDSRSDLP